MAIKGVNSAGGLGVLPALNPQEVFQAAGACGFLRGVEPLTRGAGQAQEFRGAGACAGAALVGQMAALWLESHGGMALHGDPPSVSDREL